MGGALPLAFLAAVLAHASMSAHAQVLDQFLPGLGQVATDFVDGRHLVIGHAAARETAHVLRLLGLTAVHANVQMAIIGGGHMHELPGDVSAARPRSRPSATR